ncbi:MAG: class I SAM-dependent methyltransferase family protein [Methanobacteriota archaeon]
MSQAVQVPKSSGEEARIALDRAGAVERGVKIHESGDFVQIPLSRGLGDDELALVRSLGGVLVELAAAVPRTVRAAPYENILRALKIPEDAKALLPDKWELLGDVLVLKLDEFLEDWLEQISAAYAEELGAKTVLREVAPISGQYREPGVEELWGDGTETTHVENGIKYNLDAAKLMFSSGNMDERLRMATISKPGEVVVDMFAGIGYFTLPLAKYSKPSRVVAYEINPLSHSYLVNNVALNGLDNVEPRLGDCAEAEERIADRVLMGYVGTTHLYLRKAMRILRGPGIIHYHETCPNALLPDRPTGRVMDAAKAEGLKAEVARCREVKSYAPGVSHVVLDVRVDG